MQLDLKKLTTQLANTKDGLTDDDVQVGISNLRANVICSTIMATLQGGAILSAFAVSMGATNYEVGLIASIALFGQLMIFPGIFLIHHIPRRRALVVISDAISRIAWIPIVFMPVMFVDRGVSFLLLWLLISTVFSSLPGAAWSSWLRDVLPMKRLGELTSKRARLSTVTAMACTLAAGYLIDVWSTSFPGEPNLIYAMLFLVGVILGFCGLLYLARVPEPTMKVETKTPIWNQLKLPFEDKNFARLLKFYGVWTIAVNLAGPFFVVYILRRIGLSMLWVTVLAVIGQIAGILVVTVWGRLADRFSNKSVLSVSSLFFLIAVMSWCFTTMPEAHRFTTPMLIAIHVVSGAALAGVNLAVTNISLKLSPQGRAHVYLAMFATVSAAAGVAAPIVGGALADFFQVRELAITINWLSPGDTITVSALDLRALDFVFMLAFIVGMTARRMLGDVREEGEVDDADVLDELLLEMGRPIRSVSTLIGIRRVLRMPTAVYDRLRSPFAPGRDDKGPSSGAG